MSGRKVESKLAPRPVTADRYPNLLSPQYAQANKQQPPLDSAPHTGIRPALAPAILVLRGVSIMASAFQTAANQANAQHSTGPRTPEGKTRVAQNARKHGFCAQTLRLAPEEQPLFDALQKGLLEDTRPEGALENEIFRRLLTHAWNLRRIESFESRILVSADPLSIDDAPQSNLERWARYRRDVERSYYRALNELRKLQTQRAALLQQEDQVIEALYSATPLAEITRLTKQTDSFIRHAENFKGNASRQTFTNSRKRGAALGAETRRGLMALAECAATTRDQPKAA